MVMIVFLHFENSLDNKLEEVFHNYHYVEQKKNARGRH